MSRRPSADPTSGSRVRAEQLLALAVVRQAVADAVADPARASYVGAETQADAIKFLTGDDDGGLQWWCHVGGLDAREVRGAIQRVLDGHGNGNRAAVAPAGARGRKGPDLLGESRDWGTES